jgi:hypothetical protein
MYPGETVENSLLNLWEPRECCSQMLVSADEKKIAKDRTLVPLIKQKYHNLNGSAPASMIGHE